MHILRAVGPLHASHLLLVHPPPSSRRRTCGQDANKPPAGFWLGSRGRRLQELGGGRRKVGVTPWPRPCKSSLQATLRSDSPLSPSQAPPLRPLSPPLGVPLSLRGRNSACTPVNRPFSESFRSLLLSETFFCHDPTVPLLGPYNPGEFPRRPTGGQEPAQGPSPQHCYHGGRGRVPGTPSPGERRLCWGGSNRMDVYTAVWTDF